MITSKKRELDASLTEVIGKIDAGTITCEDFDRFISVNYISESTPEAIRDRLRRRTIKNETDPHIEPETGHQSLKLPTFADRVQPKIKPAHQQSHGRAGIAHRHSARTQARQIAPALEFIRKHYGKPLSEEIISSVADQEGLKLLSTRLLTKPNIDRDWLYDLLGRLS